MIAWGTRPLIERAFAGATEIAGIPKIRRFTAGAGIVRLAVRAVHDGKGSAATPHSIA